MPTRSTNSQRLGGPTRRTEKSGNPSTTSKSEKNPAAVALGRLGGLKGGKARARSLSPARRREIARKAALARYAKREQ
jgi:hypothetical protein